ncbi:MAG: hypothetical protein A6F71_04745 [Cycloclasticus sp. symbiont of Poecilosclerida sp. M]|nr:MAG: hypothetical protein A6F71_04745 [Cycloclasticus sp. symbiont of Poecilosclerida sp. M]
MMMAKGNRVTKRAKLKAAVMVISVLVLGCASEEFGDLNDYIAEVYARKPGLIKPLPAIKPYASFRYVKDGLRNPFTPINKHKQVAYDIENIVGPGPDLARTKVGLEGFPLDTLRMVGTIAKGNQTWGLIKAGDGIIHLVLPGQYMGRNFGKIQKVDNQKIELEEYIVSAEGRWVKRQTEIELSEH